MEQFCEIILNLCQWFRRCRLKDFLSGDLAALLFGEAEPFMQFCKREHSCEVILNLDQWFRRRCRLKKKFTHDRQTDARWTDARKRPITIAQGELKTTGLASNINFDLRLRQSLNISNLWLNLILALNEISVYF